MKVTLLALLILLQTAAQSAGFVTGVVRGANGMPAAGVRVYAIGVREDADVSTAPLEGQTQTDAAGRYRLEVPPGRYYIGSGSVSSPTFYPGSRGLADARVVTVAAGGVLEAIDFSSFVPAVPSGMGVSLGTAVISGVIRFADGTPAGGIAVTAMPANAVGASQMLSHATLFSAPVGGPNTFAVNSATPQGTAFLMVVPRNGIAFTDNSGRYVIPNLPAGALYVAAGFAEAPTLFPGVTDPAGAKMVTTTVGASISNIDFTIPRPAPGISLKGQVNALGGRPAAGSRVEIRSASAVPSSYGLPTARLNAYVTVGPDGKFEFRDVRPGPYILRAFDTGIRAETKNVVVADQSLVDLDFMIRAATFSGRIVAEDGGAIPDPWVFVDAIVSTASNPNLVKSTVLPIATDGSFGRVLEEEEYQFMLRSLPEEYFFKSITAGSVDLTKGTLKLDGKGPTYVEVRVGKRTPGSETSGVRVSGRTLDAVSGAPSSAERITLCCRETGPAQRFSAPISPDGSFEFTSVPSGVYTVGLQVRSGATNLFPVVFDIELGSSGLSGIEVLTTPQFGELAARIVVEGKLPLATDKEPMSVVFTGSNGKVRVVARRTESGHHASLPSGDRYNVTVTNMPEGFAVRSISGSTEVLAPNLPGTGTPLAPTTIVITLAPQPQ